MYTKSNCARLLNLFRCIAGTDIGADLPAHFATFYFINHLFCLQSNMVHKYMLDEI